MKRALVLLAVGVFATMVQGASAAFLPRHWCPDLGLLVVIGIGLAWRSAEGGVLLAAGLGYVADLLSGTLLGQHALLRVLAFGAARGASVHFNLRGALPLALFTAVWSTANAAALAATTAFFVPALGFALADPGALAAHATANALAAPPVVAVTAWLVTRLGPEEGGRRMLRFEPRSFRA